MTWHQNPEDSNLQLHCFLCSSKVVSLFCITKLNFKVWHPHCFSKIHNKTIQPPIHNFNVTKTCSCYLQLLHKSYALMDYILLFLKLINMYTWNTGIILQNSVYRFTHCNSCWVTQRQIQQGSFCASNLSKKGWQYNYFNKLLSNCIRNSTLPLPEFLLNAYFQINFHPLCKLWPIHYHQQVKVKTQKVWILIFKMI